MIVSAAALCVVLAQGPLSRLIDYATVAAPAKRVLAELSQNAGIALATSPVTEAETLVVDVKRVPLGELMKRIAAVCNAEWKQEGDLYRLSRPALLERAEAKEEFDYRLASVKEALAETRQRLAKAPAWDPSWTRLPRRPSTGRPAIHRTRGSGRWCRDRFSDLRHLVCAPM